MSDTTPDFQTIGLLGFGTMGTGIAQVFAASGREVRVLEIDEDRAAAGTAQLSSFLAERVTRGKATDDEQAEVLGRISTTTLVDDLAGVHLVVESIAEDLDTKVDVLARVAAVVGDTTPIVTNTSALSVTDIAAALVNPGPRRRAPLLQPRAGHAHRGGRAGAADGRGADRPSGRAGRVAGREGRDPRSTTAPGSSSTRSCAPTSTT